MLQKMALDSENNGKIAAVHHTIAKKKKCCGMLFLSGDFRTTSK